MTVLAGASSRGSLRATRRFQPGEGRRRMVGVRRRLGVGSHSGLPARREPESRPVSHVRERIRRRSVSERAHRAAGRRVERGVHIGSRGTRTLTFPLGPVRWHGAVASSRCDQSVHEVATQNASMFAATGLAFGGLLCAARPNRTTATAMLLTTGLSVALVLGYPVINHVLKGAGLHAHEIGLWAAPLHIGIASVAVADTLRVIRSEDLRSQPTCSRCGYVLTGLPFRAPCPECGTRKDGGPDRMEC